ncbi:dihydrodipicolinate synthase family protein [Acidicapsa acidisoli]|uniref:dihydrodipicolinate synthase family protein n=1 Tax=Acidicapsa acidisoli TaxID=1615681 RepID=UPI0021DF66D2|nr:dihydrodipicolinate synthase family protein [Acidicapsa acidisoli]
MKWQGVLPAMTTCFDEELKVDHAFMTRHASWMLDSGCTGIVSLGSLGEAATLNFDEKIAILKNMVATANGRAPIVAAISALSTVEAVSLAKAAADCGCEGLMVLPPYVYLGDWREMKAHVAAIFEATPLSCMLYNNPVAYGTDFLPEQIHELASEHPNMQAVKESSTDVRRIAAIRAIEDGRLQILVGVDDLIVEGIAAGATGWIAGLVNALPVESVALFDLATQGRARECTGEAFELYRWFLPLLRMDTVPKFIQLIKLVQQEVGEGSARVRPPRLELTGSELNAACAVIRAAIENRPSLMAKVE